MRSSKQCKASWGNVVMLTVIALEGPNVYYGSIDMTRAV